MNNAPRKLHVLIVDDSPEDRELYRRLMHDSGEVAFEFSEAETGEQGLELCQTQAPDCLLLDYRLPDIDGLEFLSELLEDGSDLSIPIIMLTGQGNESIAIEAMRRGAQDYLVKGQVNRQILSRTMRYAIERQRLQAELKNRARQQIELKNQFLSHVSHELRSPLTVVYQFVTLVLDGLAGEITAQQREYLDTALRNVRQLQGMIDDLLEATRAESGKLSVDARCIDLPSVLRDAVGSLQATASNKQIELSQEALDELPPVTADPARVRQILVNLIDNALKFTPNGGRVSVAIAPEENGSFLRVSVSDTGPGISQASRERIFDRLHQEERTPASSRKGLGLGLFISKELVTRHGGRIWVEGESGHGSTISFTLPTFSLSRVLVPVITDRHQLKTPIQLVGVHVAVNDPNAQSSFADTINAEVANVIQSCVLPDLDVVLPRIGNDHPPGAHFIVACTDDAGAGVLVKRLQGQLRRSKVLADSGVQVNVAATNVRPPEIEPGELIESIVEKVAHEVTELVRMSADVSAGISATGETPEGPARRSAA